MRVQVKLNFSKDGLMDGLSCVNTEQSEKKANKSIILFLMLLLNIIFILDSLLCKIQSIIG